MRTTVSKYLVRTFTAVLSMVMLTSMLAPAISSATTNYAPDNNDTGPGGTTMTYDVSHAAYNNVDQTILEIYAPTPWVAVSVSGADMCEQPSNNLDGTKDVTNSAMTGVPYDTPITGFTLLGNGAGSSDVGYYRKANRCNNFSAKPQVLQTSPVPTSSVIRGTGQGLNGGSTNSDGTAMSTLALTAFSDTTNSITIVQNGVSVIMYEFRLTASWLNSACGGANTKCGVNSFRVQVEEANGGPGSTWTPTPDDTAYVSQQGDPLGTQASHFGLNIGTHTAPFGNFKAYFGSDCGLPKNASRGVAIGIYDDDNVNAQNAQDINNPFIVHLETALKGTPKNSSNWVEIPPSQLSFTGWDIVQLVNPGGIPGAGNNWWRLANYASGKTGLINFKVFGGWQYRFSIRSLDPNNNLQYSLPFPSVFTNVCNQWDVTPNTTGVPPTTDAGSPVTWGHYITNSSGAPSAAGIGYSVREQITDTAGVTTSSVVNAGSYPFPIGSPANLPPLYDTRPTTVADIGKVLCERLEIAPYSYATGGAVTTSNYQCTLITAPTYKPYVKAWGGDVEAGFGPDDGTGMCTDTTQPARILTNKDVSVLGLITAGSGAQLGVQAQGSITGFDSAMKYVGPNIAIPANPSNGIGLTFANKSVLGLFGQSTNCIDYTQNLRTPTAPPSNTIPGQTVSAGQPDYLANGDVYIRGDIKYAAGNYSLSNMPSYKLVVKGGDIYIDKSVTQLDGTYIAQAANGVGGHIYTCALGMGSAVSNSNAAHALCKTQLTVNGSFVADHIYLMRTYGDPLDLDLTTLPATDNNFTTSNAAEKFNYSPEQWLGYTTQTVGKPQSIISLPPTL